MKSFVVLLAFSVISAFSIQTADARGNVSIARPHLVYGPAPLEIAVPPAPKEIAVPPAPKEIAVPPRPTEIAVPPRN